MAIANLIWTPAVGELQDQVVRYRELGDLTWIVAATVGPTVDNYQITGLLSNVIYEFNIQSICAGLGAVNSIPDTAAYLTCPVITATPGSSSLTFSFDHVGGDVDSYDIVLTTSLDVPVPGTAETISSPSGTISRTYSSLPPAETYKFKVTVNAGEFSLDCQQTGQPYDCTLTGEVICEMTYTTQCADCGLQFSSYVNNNIARLDVGTVTSSLGCTVGNYVIDWYLDSTSNPIEFTSGVGSDPDITEFHPFTGNAARPVVAGNWIPVIRYIYLNGFKYTSMYTAGERYSPDLRTCLPQITIQNYTCSNGNLTPPSTLNSGYTHQVQYVNTTQVAADSSRTIRIDLNTDGTTEYLAWEFTGDQIADRIKIYYISGVTETLLEDWVIGLDNSTYIFTSQPYKWDSQFNYKKVTDLSTIPYVLGDWLKIEITPSYNAPSNTNTNWTLKFRCLPSFDCNDCGDSWGEMLPDTAVMTYDGAECEYELTVNINTNVCNFFGSQFYNYQSISNIANLENNAPFTNGQGVTTSNGVFGGSLGFLRLLFRKNSTCITTYATTVNTTCTALASSATIVKSGNILTYTFANNTDYLLYKNSYNTVIAAANMVNYTSDNTQNNHYKFIYSFVRIANSCGDAQTTYNIYFHYSSPVVFDDVNRIMTVTLTSTTLNYSPGCGSCTTTIQANISNCNNTISLPNFSSSTYITSIIPFSGIYHPVTTNDTTIVQANYRFLFTTHLNPVCTLGSHWCLSAVVPVNNYYQSIHYVAAFRGTITNNADPLNNWRLESQDKTASGCLAGTWTIIHEVAGGVRII